jgi:hypothetical protein
LYMCPNCPLFYLEKGLILQLLKRNKESVSIFNKLVDIVDGMKPNKILKVDDSIYIFTDYFFKYSVSDIKIIIKSNL